MNRIEVFINKKPMLRDKLVKINKSKYFVSKIIQAATFILVNRRFMSQQRIRTKSISKSLVRHVNILSAHCKAGEFRRFMVTKADDAFLQRNSSRLPMSEPSQLESGAGNFSRRSNWEFSETSAYSSSLHDLNAHNQQHMQKAASDYRRHSYLL